MTALPDSLTAERAVREILQDRAGRSVLRVSSGSMKPRLEEGDRIHIERVSPRSLMPGDVVVYASESAGLVVHRLIWRDRPLGRPTRIYTKGDALDTLDRSVAVERVLGRVVSIDRGRGLASPTTTGDRLRCIGTAAGCFVRRFRRRLAASVLVKR
jgi:signal peptidase I